MGNIFYINEIILKIVPEDESDPVLFSLYKTTLYDLPEQNWVSKLRSFEISILDFLGYLPSLEYEYLNNTPIETSKTYEKYRALQFLFKRFPVF